MQRVQYEEPVEIFGALQDFVQCDWSDAPSRLKQTISLHSVINISAAPALEMTSLTYKDGGALSKCSDIFSHQALSLTTTPMTGLARWPVDPAYDVTFKAPVWNWVQGKPGYLDEHKLQFSRVLAIAVDAGTAAQGNDGNVGLAVPG